MFCLDRQKETYANGGATIMRFKPSRLASALVFGFLLASSTAALAATTHWVNDDDPNGFPYAPSGTSCTNPGYSTIGAAVAAAGSADSIMAGLGTYTEYIILPKDPTLLGAPAGFDLT